MKMHLFHMVNMSPWPLISSFSALTLTLSLISMMFFKNLNLIIMSILMLTWISYSWWRDITRESSFENYHSNLIMMGIKMGMILFITSEVMFFFSFFWAFFQSSISPNVEMGENWPPQAISPFNPMNIPLLNTLILLSSGVSITWSHHAINENNFKTAMKMLKFTIFLGIYFTFLQAFEYNEAPFMMQDSSYGSTFFVATGFHGLHVLIGSTFLLMTALMLHFNWNSFNHIIGFETAAWYWHFVDVVWLFLYSTIYWWGI